MRNLNFIGPYSFSQGLVKWAFSGSKSAQSLDGATCASRIITTLDTWMKESAKNPNVIYDSRDVDVFADNTQCKGKTSIVKEERTTPIGKAHFLIKLFDKLSLYSIHSLFKLSKLNCFIK